MGSQTPWSPFWKDVTQDSVTVTLVTELVWAGWRAARWPARGRAALGPRPAVRGENAQPGWQPAPAAPRCSPGCVFVAGPAARPSLRTPPGLRQVRETGRAAQGGQGESRPVRILALGVSTLPLRLSPGLHAEEVKLKHEPDAHQWTTPITSSRLSPSWCGLAAVGGTAPPAPSQTARLTSGTCFN